ncbi:MAG TPA: NAD(P)-dependent oxidoreductase [Jatrophihabitans sp.]
MSGAAGKLGGAVVTALRGAGVDVVAVDLRMPDGAGLDLRDFDAVDESMDGADAVIHLAAVPSPEGIAATALVENNAMSTFNVLCRAAPSIRWSSRRATRSCPPTADLLDRWFADVERRKELRGTESAFDSTRAQQLIGWRPTFAW